MENDTEDIDQLIKDTLSKEEVKFYKNLEEEGLFASVKGMFKGKLKWVIIMMFIVNFIALGFLIYAVIQFFGATDTYELIKWFGVSFLCILIMSMLKLYSWMQMNKNALLREIKRLELLVTASSLR